MVYRACRSGGAGGTSLPAKGPETFRLIWSMSAVGTCADNAAAESFFGMFERERVNRRQYRTRAEARADVFDYLERFHNPRRRRQLESVKADALLLAQPYA